MNTGVYGFIKEHFSNEDFCLTNRIFASFITADGIMHALPLDVSDLTRKDLPELDNHWCYNRYCSSLGKIKYSSVSLLDVQTSDSACDICLDGILKLINPIVVYHWVLLFEGVQALHGFKTSLNKADGVSCLAAARALEKTQHQITELEKYSSCFISKKDMDEFFLSTVQAVLSRYPAVKNEERLKRNAYEAWFSTNKERVVLEQSSSAWKVIMEDVYLRWAEYFLNTMSSSPSSEIIHTWIKAAFDTLLNDDNISSLIPSESVFKREDYFSFSTWVEAESFYNAFKTVSQKSFPAWQQSLFDFQQSFENKSILLASTLHSLKSVFYHEELFSNIEDICQVGDYFVFKLPKAALSLLLPGASGPLLLGDVNEHTDTNLLEVAVSLLDSCLPGEALKAAQLAVK